MPRTFNHHLNVVLPGDLGQLAQRFEFGELRAVAGVGERARAQTVAQGKANVVLLEDLADVFEMLVQKILAMILHHPFSQDRSAAADDSRHAAGGQRNVLDQYSGVDGHVIDALLGLLLDHFQHDVDVQILHAPHAREGFVDRHGADRHGRIASMMALRMRGISPPVDRSITVSAP